MIMQVHPTNESKSSFIGINAFYSDRLIGANIVSLDWERND